MLHTALAAGAALVAVAFALSTFERWLDRRRSHDLAWTLAFVQFAIAAAALSYGSEAGWSGASFRCFYLFGAVTNVPFLALGTVELLAPGPWARRSRTAVAALASFAVGVLVATPFTHPLPPGELARGSEVFGPLPRLLAAVASGGGALVVIGGAILSARRRRLVRANGLIALGTAITGASGLLQSVADSTTAFAMTLVAGITVIFAGFLVAAGASPTNATRAAAPSPSSRAGARPRT